MTRFVNAELDRRQKVTDDKTEAAKNVGRVAQREAENNSLRLDTHMANYDNFVKEQKDENSKLRGMVSAIFEFCVSNSFTFCCA